MGVVYESGYMYISDNSSSNSIGNAGSFGTRGPIVFTESGTFNITEYGLKIGDKVNVICIGGGGGGGAGVSSIGSAAGSGGGYGGGGNGGASNSDYYYCIGGGGGGSGYAAQATITLEAETIDITIGAGGAATNYYSRNGYDGGATSFGTYLIAAGGKGGDKGYEGATSSYYSVIAYGGGGNGGTRGESATIAAKGSATYSTSTGGAGANGTTVSNNFMISNESATSIKGSGAVFIWY